MEYSNAVTIKIKKQCKTLHLKIKYLYRDILN
jgi:hypothetical protein